MRRRACLLCGAENQETKFQIVRWREPQPGNPPVVFTPIPRCVDRAGCRARVEAIDPETKRPGRWEVIDAGDPMPASMPAARAPLPREPTPAQAPDPVEPPHPPEPREGVTAELFG